MNIKSWILENKTASTLLIVFLLFTAGLGYLAWSAWDDYAVATGEYTTKAKELDTLSHNTIFPSASNMRKLLQTLSQDQASLDNLKTALQAYKIPSFGEIEKIKPQDQPQYFQDALRAQVTAIKSLASSLGSTLPPTFYLGMDEYENRLPQPDQLPILSRQLTALSWIAKTLVSQKGVIVADFARLAGDSPKSSGAQKKPATAGTDSHVFDSLGSTRVALRCGQGAFRELINTLSLAPYFLLIEDIKVQNSVGEPPRRDATPAAIEQTSDGSSPIQRLPIVVGRESLNVLLKIRILDFPASKGQTEMSK